MIACAVCLDSAFGSRGFNLAFVFLMLAPFVVIAGVGGVLAWLRPHVCREPGLLEGLRSVEARGGFADDRRAPGGLGGHVGAPQ